MSKPQNHTANSDSPTEVGTSDKDQSGAMEESRSVPPLVIAFAAGIVLLAGMAALGVALDTNWQIFKVGEESNAPTWFSSIQLFVVAAILFIVIRPQLDRHRPASWLLIIVPGLFLALSLDEVAMMHEQLGELVLEESGAGSGLRTGPWVFVFVPIVAVATLAAAVVFWPYMKGRRDVIGRAIVGIALLGISAAGLELLGNLPADGSQMHRLLGFLEEIGEMVAVNILLWAALLVAHHEGIAIQRVDSGRIHPPAP